MTSASRITVAKWALACVACLSLELFPDAHISSRLAPSNLCSTGFSACQCVEDNLPAWRDSPSRAFLSSKPRPHVQHYASRMLRHPLRQSSRPALRSQWWSQPCARCLQNAASPSAYGVPLAGARYGFLGAEESPARGPRGATERPAIGRTVFGRCACGSHGDARPLCAVA